MYQYTELKASQRTKDRQNRSARSRAVVGFCSLKINVCLIGPFRPHLSDGFSPTTTEYLIPSLLSDVLAIDQHSPPFFAWSRNRFGHRRPLLDHEPPLTHKHETAWDLPSFLARMAFISSSWFSYGLVCTGPYLHTSIVGVPKSIAPTANYRLVWTWLG